MDRGGGRAAVLGVAEESDEATEQLKQLSMHAEASCSPPLCGWRLQSVLKGLHLLSLQHCL